MSSSLGKELRQARLSAGMTQEALSSTAKVDRSYISQLERNLKSPTVDTLFRLCRAMGVSASKIIARIEKE
jgi:transcriptional regulator with XRE-family HTH domain